MSLTNTYSVDTTNKIITYVSGGAVDTVRDLYSFLMDTFDELGAMDDTIPMSAQTPTEFTLINGWFIDEESLKTLKGGAITTSGYKHAAGTPQGIRVLTLGAAANLTSGDIGKVVLGGTTGDTGKLLAYNVADKKLWVRCDDISDLFDDNAEAITVDGQACGSMTAVSETGESVYANLYTLGTIEAGGTVYIVQNGVKVTGWWSTGHIDVLIKVKEFDALINSGNLTIFLREYGKLFDHFPITVTSGRNAVPLATSPDLNNTTVVTTVDDYTIGISFGAISKDLNNGAGSQPYAVEIDCNGHTLAEMYEYLKYATMKGSVINMSGIDGEQYISANGSYSPVKQAPFGTFAGGKFFGARGVWIKEYDADDAKNFQLIDSDGDTQNPPNTVTVKVDKVEIGDRVVVFRLTDTLANNGVIDSSEYTLDAGNNQNDTDILVKENISSDTPQAGVVRIGDDRYEYSAWTSKTFTLVSSLSQNYDEDDTAYVPLIDEQAGDVQAVNTLIQSVTIPVLVRVRKKGILPFEVESSVGANGMLVSAIRTTDSIVQ